MRFKKSPQLPGAEGQGCGIIMEVTRLLLLGPFFLVKWPVNPNILAASVSRLNFRGLRGSILQKVRALDGLRSISTLRK